MNTFLWILAGVLAAVFLLTGAFKIVRSREQLAASGQGWVAGFTDGQVKLIGVAEVLGALGLILPPLVDVVPVLTPIAAVGLALVMVGAAATHARRGEYPMVIANAVLLAGAIVVAWGRFGAYAF